MTHYATFVLRSSARAALMRALGRKVWNAEQNDFVLHLNRNIGAWVESEAKKFAEQMKSKE